MIEESNDFNNKLGFDYDPKTGEKRFFNYDSKGNRTYLKDDVEVEKIEKLEKSEKLNKVIKK